jgi:DNA-binding CsgD family transcriptional regulator
VGGELVGRDDELRALAEFLAAVPPGAQALVLEGEAGIGKSTLWLAGRQIALERGARVLSSRPAEAERGLAYAGLEDLLEEVFEQVAPSLSPPRRRALETALLVRENEDGVDPRALGVAVRNTLELLAADGRVVVAIDDVQWLDESSSAALSFGVRRLECPVHLLLARRTVEGAEPSRLEGALSSELVDRLPVGPLSLGALQHLLQLRLERVFSRPTLIRIHETSGGNPFYALELARALPPDVDPTRPLPVPETLDGLLRARLGGLPGPTRDALVLVSALGTPSLTLLQAAGVDEDALEQAEAARVVERENGDVRFTHPLLASVVYQGISETARRRAHRSLADVVVDPLERARHLALSTDAPDPDVAEALERAAAAADSQGAPIVAAELGEHALRLTPPEIRADVDRRAIAVARAHGVAGGVDRGLVLAGELVVRSSPGRERAEALTLLADLGSEEPGRAIPLLHDALVEAEGQPALEASIHQRLSLIVRFTEGLVPAERHARAAADLASQLDDDALRASALAGLAIIRFNAGEADALRLAERAHDLAPAVAASQAAADAGFALAHILTWSFQLDRARVLLEALQREWSERDERMVASALWYLALVELRAGRLALADEYAEGARDLSAQYMRDEAAESPQNLFPSTLVAAHRGELERARELAERMTRLAELHAARISGAATALAVIELWSGDPEAAVARFAAAEQTSDAADRIEPAMCWWRAEQVEALLEVGLLEEAVDRLDAWEADARRLGRDWSLAHATRCRGLVAVARGDIEGATSLLEGAVSRLDALGDPFGSARALLALAAARRRSRQKRAAREAIEAAAAIFDHCGAHGWAGKARSELGRIGGRQREEGLTAAERRVAALVAEGRTNREVAAALYVGERTVETHLSHIYSKLGVRSRTELARQFPPP